MENDHSLPKKRYRGYLTSLNPVLPRSTRLRLEQQEQNRQNFQEVANNIQPQEDRQYILSAGCEQNCNQHDEREHDGDESDGMEDGHISSVHEQPQEVFLTNEMNKDVSDSDNDLQESSSYPISSAESSVDDSNSSAESSVDDSNSDEEYNGSNLQHNPDLQRKFKDGFATTKFECMLMILTFSLRHSLSTVAMQDLCKLINCLFEEDVIPTSEYWFKKTFGSNLPYRVHLYCSDCEAYIGDIKQLGNEIRVCPCPVCSKMCTVFNLNNGSFFITLSLRSQIVDLLETTPDIIELLNYRWNRESGEKITDIYDSEKYKELCKNDNFLSSPFNLSCCISTDGISIYNSTKNTNWPIIMRLNELPPQYRFNQNNFILGGLWFGKKDPNMLAFLSPFLKELNQLYKSGFHWKAPNGEKIHSKLIVFNCIVDSVAKPLIQCIKQFNGYWGCGYCYHPGCVLDEGNNHAKYVMTNNDLTLMNDLSFEYTVDQKDKNGQHKLFHVKDRSNEEMRSDMKRAENLREDNPKIDIKGVKGLSSLFLLTYFDIVFGFGIDWLHAVCLGVVKSVANLWFDSTSKGAPYYLSKAKRQLVNNNLSKLKLPAKLRRRDLNIEDRCHWKGNEWRTWLLFCSLPVLKGILPPLYLKHHCILVSVLFAFLKDSIEPEELDEATWMCSQYVTEFQVLYGKKNMHYNIHLLLHIGKCVKLMGPLWTNSLFCFESFNGSLARLVKGTRGVMSQISHKYSRFKNIPRSIHVYGARESVISFCSYLLTYRIVTIASKVNGVTLLNKPISIILTEEENNAFFEAGIEVTNLTYERMIKDGTKFHASCYRRKGVKSDDTTVILTSGAYGIIKRIILIGEQVFVLIHFINIENNEFLVRHICGAKSPHIKTCSPIVYGRHSLENVNTVYKKAIFINTEETDYVTEFPNVFETD